MKAKIVLKSFPNHQGIPGHQGGSLPANAGSSGDKKSGSTRNAKQEKLHELGKKHAAAGVTSLQHAYKHPSVSQAEMRLLDSASTADLAHYEAGVGNSTLTLTTALREIFPKALVEAPITGKRSEKNTIQGAIDMKVGEMSHALQKIGWTKYWDTEGYLSMQSPDATQRIDIGKSLNDTGDNVGKRWFTYYKKL